MTIKLTKNNNPEIEDELYKTFSEIRYLFHALASITDQLHANIKISASQRAILETLSSQGPMSVPMIARLKKVSRQHIQLLVNSLLKENLVHANQNPAHERSQLVQLTPKGEEIFAEIRKREQTFLTYFSKNMDIQTVHKLKEELHHLRTRLEQCNLNELL